eukprot:3914354-Amphidinium_carterae.1
MKQLLNFAISPYIDKPCSEKESAHQNNSRQGSKDSTLREGRLCEVRTLPDFWARVWVRGLFNSRSPLLLSTTKVQKS